ncbi:MAG: hypothetical protein IV090_03125 [Candidatus Sericytochromatia bacterium]|nr:hypothetical protein [Candidatus Sericytochromatia bacterium]
MKRMALSLIVSLALMPALMSTLSSCTERLLPGSVGTNQQSAQTASLKLTLLFQDPQQPTNAPGEFLNKLKTLKLEIRENNSNLKSDEISLDDSAKAAAELSRTTQKIPVGQVEVKISFLDKDGKELQSLSQSLKTVANGESTLKLAVYGSSAQVLGSTSPSQVLTLSSRWQEQLSLQKDLQGLYQQNSTLLVQARTLLRSQAPEDRIQLEQVRSELNSLAQQIEPKEARLTAIESELKSLESQSTATDMVKLLLLLQQAETQRKDVDVLLQRRSMVFSQSKVLLSQGGAAAQEQLSQSQSELQTINDSLNTKQAELEKTIAELEKLQVQVVAANTTELNAEQLKAQLALLTPSIEQLSTHETELKQQIAGLIEKTDALSVRRREGFEAELQGLQRRLADLKAQRDALQKRLDAVQAK